ncbi:MAG TPA: MFS transporter [Steroidobacteraceae bacterium]|jgi:MFS family permease
MSRAQKITLLIALYFAQGLPFGFFTIVVPAMLRQSGQSRTAIGLAGIGLTLPWLLKFLWAPFVDHRGTRRSWLLTLQISGLAVAAAITQLQFEGNYVLLFAAAFVFNLIAATQDIATDGLAVRMLDAHELGIANGIQVGAYRVGMMFGGGLVLTILTLTDWSFAFVAMAALLAVTIVPVLLMHEPPGDAREIRQTTARLSLAWLRRLLTPGILLLAGLIFCYRFGDQMLTNLLIPFLTDQRLDLAKIAMLKGNVGNAMSIVGAFAGGWLAFSTSRRTALLVSGLGQVASFMIYVVAALGVGGVGVLWVATIAEAVLGTMATVALFALMMDASDPEHAGTDYTLLACVVIVVGMVANLCGGLLADAFGYATAFTTGAVLALAGCLTLVWVLDRYQFSERVAHAWRTPKQPRAATPSQTSATEY